MNPNINPDSTRAVIERFNEAFNRHDVDGVMNMMSNDCIFENTNPTPDGARLVGAVEVRAYWQKFFAANPDARFEAEDIIVAGDRSAAIVGVLHQQFPILPTIPILLFISICTVLQSSKQRQLNYHNACW